MATLTRRQQQKIHAILEGVRTRICLKKAKQELQAMIKEIEGKDCKIDWSDHNVAFSIQKPIIKQQKPILQTPKPKLTPIPTTPTPAKVQPIPETPTSKQSRLRELKLKRQMYLNQLRIVQQKIRQRQSLNKKSPFAL